MRRCSIISPRTGRSTTRSTPALLPVANPELPPRPPLRTSANPESPHTLNRLTRPRPPPATGTAQPIRRDVRGLPAGGGNGGRAAGGGGEQREGPPRQKVDLDHSAIETGQTSRGLLGRIRPKPGRLRRGWERAHTACRRAGPWPTLTQPPPTGLGFEVETRSCRVERVPYLLLSAIISHRRCSRRCPWWRL